MVGWHQRLNRPEFESTLGVGDGQGGLECCIPRGAKSWTWLSKWTELNWTEKTKCKKKKKKIKVNLYIFLWCQKENIYKRKNINFMVCWITASQGVHGNGYPLQYSCLENPTDRGAWWATVRGVVRSRTGLSNEAHSTRCPWPIPEPVIVTLYGKRNSADVPMLRILRWQSYLDIQVSPM